MIHIKTTLGAILLGCVVSAALTGMTIVQTFLYFRLYPKDQPRIKLMVIGVLLLDTTHSSLMIASTWDYFVLNFGNEEVVDKIPITLGLTVAFTATITFLVQLFFSHRVYRLSRNNLYITAPLVLLSCGRLVAALVSTTEMGRLKSFHAFVEHYGYVFTLGLSMACTVDLGITAAMCYFLQMSRTGFGTMDHVIDIIMLYTLNNGALTCVTTIVSMILWLTMPRNLIFLGLHFTISKLYANSLLATLNSRRLIRKRTKMGVVEGEHALPVMFPSYPRSSRARFASTLSPTGEMDPARLEISVEKTVQCDADEGDQASGIESNS
ncbi:hypothetical protein V8E53_006163 [Lactarius tabidus]